MTKTTTGADITAISLMAPCSSVAELDIVPGGRCGPSVHGDVPHKLFSSATVGGEPIGTLSPMPGMEKVCPTEQVRQESTTLTGLPSIVSVPPMVPVTRPQNGLRNGVQPS